MSDIIRANIGEKLGVRTKRFEEIPDSGNVTFVMDNDRERARLLDREEPVESETDAEDNGGDLLPTESGPDSAPEPVYAYEPPDISPSAEALPDMEDLRRMLEDREEAFAARLEEAYEKGRLDGERTREDAEGLLADRFAVGLEKVDALARTLETLARHEALELALLLARRILQREIQANPLALIDEIRNSTSEIKDTRQLTIRLNEQDLEAVRALAPDFGKHFPSVANVTLATGKDLERGDCVIDTDMERINLTLNEQLDRLRRSLEEEIR